MTPMRLLTLALALLIAPVAAAEDSPPKEEAPQDEGTPAWVEDCPPEHMCAYSEPQPEERPESSGCEPSYVCESGPAPDEPVCDARTNESCVVQCENCRGGPAEEPSGTCMDGAQAGEDCRDDVQYMVPPADAPAEADPVKADAGQASRRNDAPAAGVALALMAGAGAALGVAVRRGR